MHCISLPIHYISLPDFLTAKFDDSGVEEAYFPLFISSSALQREKDHVEGFAPEVAWVTRSGQTDLPEPIAVRPTSETVMYPAYARWIQSHRDMPLRLNQWCNVVRWEFKHPQPFLRSREFLWQEGHSVFNTKTEADLEVLEILELYRRVYEELLAVPVVKGTKSEKEKFAGALYSTTCEIFIPAAGRAIQGCTSHCLGQNFARMFRICVEGREPGQPTEFCWQNSWGFTTRSIGVMTMVHGDDQGLVLPPRVAAVQVVVVPVGLTAKTAPAEQEAILERCASIVADLKTAGVRAYADVRDNYTVGWKFNHWELKGVPLRLELGPRDLVAGEVRAVRRFDGAKEQLSLEGLTATIARQLDAIHDAMLAKARANHEAHLKLLESRDWDQVVPALDSKCMVLIPWCEEPLCEEDIKERTARQAVAAPANDADARAPSMGAKSLCIPHAQPKKIVEGQKCIACERLAKSYTLFARSY
jgi:prolyl-tRNA synthetase